MTDTTHCNVIVLGVWMSVVGIPREIDQDNGLIKFDDFVLKVNPIELEKMPILFGLIGEQVEILRTNIPFSEYLIREHHAHCSELGQPTVDAGCASHRDTETDGQVPDKGDFEDAKDE
jgi:hypothetical protein